MNVRILVPCIVVCAAVFMFGDLRAQDAAPEQQPSPAVSAPQTAPAQQPAAAEAPKPAAQQAAVPAQKAPAPQPAAPAAPAAVSAEAESLTLQDMTDGDFRYTRIQGMTFEKKKILAAGEENTPDAAVKDSSSSGNGWVVKIALICIVVLIFLLYRFGKRGRKRRVFRRISK